MAEYIEREAAYDDFEKCNSENPKWTPSRVKTLIARQKSADVARVWHGWWIRESDGGTRCSVCNKQARDVTGGGDAPVDLSDMPYCPKCGAKMDGGDGNSDMT